MLDIKVSGNHSPILTDGYKWEGKIVKVTATEITHYKEKYILYLGPKAIISKYTRYKIVVEVDDFVYN